MNQPEMTAAVSRACDADGAIPHPLYVHPSAPTFYPDSYLLRSLLRVRQGAGGVPEVVTA